MTPGPARRSEATLFVEGAWVTVRRVGPGRLGSVWISRDGTACYRRIRMEDAPLTLRRSFQALATGWPLVAAVAKTWQPEEDEEYFWIRYSPHDPGTPLLDLLGHAEPRRRLDAVLAALRALPSWSSARQEPWFVMPADVVLKPGGAAVLLPSPPLNAMSVGELLDEPERAAYLPPDLLRGSTQSVDQTADRYAVGKMLLRCLSPPPDDMEPDMALRLAATGDAVAADRLSDFLPTWLAGLPATEQLLAHLSRLVAPDPEIRRRVSLADLEKALIAWSDYFEPRHAAEYLRNTGRASEAYRVLQEALLGGESYELLVETAEVAGQALDRSLEAVDLLERAIVLEPARPRAYLVQFQMIASARHSEQLSGLAATGSPLLERMDARIRRDFDALPASTQAARELAMAEYLMWRMELAAAAEFIESRLIPDDPRPWDRLALVLKLVATHIGLGRIADARAALSHAKNALRHGRESQAIDETHYHQYGREITALEASLLQIPHGMPRTGGTG